MNVTRDVPLRVVVIGCGRMGRLHAQAIANHSASQLVGVCDIDRDGANELGKQYGVPAFCSAVELLKQMRPEVAIVATPDHLHRDVTFAAIDEHCHVFCEKPLAETVADAREMVDAAQRANVMLGVNYNRRYGFAYQQAKLLLNKGELGRIIFLNIHVVDAVPPPSVARAPYVMLTTLLTHHFDLVRFLAGEIRAVFADFGPVVEGLHRKISVYLELISNENANVSGSYLSTQRRTSESATITGSNGIVILNDVVGPVFHWDHNETHMLRPNHSSSADAFWLTNQYHLHDFLDRLLRGEPPAVSGWDGLRGLEIVEAARRSHEQKTLILLDS